MTYLILNFKNIKIPKKMNSILIEFRVNGQVRSLFLLLLWRI